MIKPYRKGSYILLEKPFEELERVKSKYKAHLNNTLTQAQIIAEGII